MVTVICTVILSLGVGPQDEQITVFLLDFNISLLMSTN